MKKTLNTTWVYVLSIIGLLCCCIMGSGVLFSAPAFIMAQNKLKDAQLSPDDYEGDYNAMNNAKLFALIVLIINSLFLIYNVYWLINGGYEEFMEAFNEAMLETQNL